MIYVIGLQILFRQLKGIFFLNIGALKIDDTIQVDEITIFTDW